MLLIMKSIQKVNSFQVKTISSLLIYTTPHLE
nr:MAG TPA: hypothetical protein [Caudoviricetes sp.]